MTAIEWTHRPGTTGESWNAVTGCTPVSEGCANCYARRMARRLAGRYGYPPAPHEFDVTLHRDKWREPLKWRKPRTVFVCSMSDLFHEDVDEYFRADLWSIMCGTPQNTYIVLTKRAQIMHDWIVENETDTPFNIWLGVTAENQKRADERIPWLVKTPAAVRFVSVEPMLGRIDAENYLGIWTNNVVNCNQRMTIGQPLTPNLFTALARPRNATLYKKQLDWVVCGAETGPGARRMPMQAAIDLRNQCRAAAVPFFFKKVGPHFPYTPVELQAREWPR